MSKSLGNGIDPMDLIDEYGCDSLRFYLTTTSAMGMDIRFDTDKVASTWNFINKVWNASRFVLMKLEGFKKEDYSLKNLRDGVGMVLQKNVLFSGTIMENLLWGVDCLAISL